jgi:hypothetical protein
VNVGTGALYELRSEEEAAAAQRAMQANYAELTKLSAELREREQEPSEDLRELVAARMRGEGVVPVSGEVAQIVKLGTRERERRRKRSKAARDARKRNRG